jgi:hypothetical protein
VSRRWKNIILSPYWKTLGYNIYGAHLTNGNSAVTRSASFLRAVKSHLFGLVDVNVSLLSDQSFDSVLDTFLQIKPLQRLRLLYSYLCESDSNRAVASTYASALIPKCRDLAYLNLSNMGSQVKISLEGMANIVKVSHSDLRDTTTNCTRAKRECQTWRSCIWVIVSK